MATILLFAPLAGALLCGFLWPLIGERAGQVLATALVFLSAALAWVLFLGFDGETVKIPLARWIESGSLIADWAIRLDRLTVVMLVVVTSVSALVHLYSFGYMADDVNWEPGEPYQARFFAFLSLFTFAMLALVMADNIVQLFFGWEGVGLASYLLIGFYNRKDSANAAAIKAFVVNRVGDFAFILGIAALYLLTDSVDFDTIFAAAPGLAEMRMTFLWRDWNAADVAAVLLFVGAMGKSAQLFLHTWLPDAMEGPTPVSALIHAATMVTAGVFLVCRMSPLFEYAVDAKTLVTVIGASTAFFAATVGLVQNDIKRVIAYSTCSQLGYMFVAAGVGAYPVALFHLFTHAFFKALLFLGAGSVITACHHEQDMRHYGGLRKKIPFTFWSMMIGTLAITGVGIPLTHWGFAGFLSKDAVIESAWIGSSYAFWMLVIAAAMTSFYSWRLMFLTFYGESRAPAPAGEGHGHHGDHGGHGHHEPKESPASMLVVLGALSLGSVVAGMVWYNSFFGSEEGMRAWFGMEVAATEAEAGAEAPAAATEAVAAAAPVAPKGAMLILPFDEARQAAVNARLGFDPAAAAAGEDAHAHAPTNIILAAHGVPAWVKVSPFVAMLIGLALAWLFYIRDPAIPARLARQQQPLYRFLLNKWYFDEVYDFVFVRGGQALGRLLWKGGDGAVIDGTINGVAMGVVPLLTRFSSRLQSGFLFHYAFAMVMGIVILVTWMTLLGGAR